LWNRKGFAIALPLFLLTWPLQWFDYLNPEVPLSLYVECVKMRSEREPGCEPATDGPA